MKPVALLTGCISALLLAASLLITNFVQMLSLIILPFSRRAFRHWNRIAVGYWARSTILMMEHITRTPFEFEGDVISSGENAIVIPNHQSMVDIMMTVKLAQTPGRLGDIKQFAKDIIKWVPGLGWGMFFVDGIFLKRDWSRDANTIFKTFNRIHKSGMPFWVINYPEGTRATPRKIKQSQEFAHDRGLPVMNHVMIPRPKGFVATLSALRDRLDAVYDMTIKYEGHIPTFWELLSGQIKDVIRVRVKRYPIAALPREEKEIQDWLIERFVEKETWLKS